MSEHESAFLKMIKRMNWTFIIFQIIVLIFYIGISYARLVDVEEKTECLNSDIEKAELRILTKADKEDIDELKKDFLDRISEIKTDVREIRNNFPKNQVYENK